MKNILISLSLLALLAAFGLFVRKETVEAQTAVLPQLLRLPAPPPPNPYFTARARSRPEDFYDREKIPSDEAPLEDLIDYWQAQSGNYRELGYNVFPSDKTLGRLLEAIEEKPELLASLLYALPATPEATDFVKRMYDRELSREEPGDERLATDEIRKWLVYRSHHFTDELLQIAERVEDTSVGYVSGQKELLALARVDWEKARHVIARLYNDSSQPVAQTLARWAYYEHALREGSDTEADRWRDELKKVVEDRRASDGNRDLAFDALVHTPDFPGRDDWYFSLLEDASLHDLRVGGQSYTGLTTLLLYSPPAKYRDRMLEIVKSGSPAARAAAVRNLGVLLNDKDEEVMRALLPWLENPGWAKEYNGERSRLIGALAHVRIPESVPGLLAVLEEVRTARKNAEISENRTADRMHSNTDTMADGLMQIRLIHDFGGIIDALGRQKDPRAVPALRSVLNEVESWQRRGVVSALLAAGGFTVTEQIAALEDFARTGGDAANFEQTDVSMLSNKAVDTAVESEEPPLPAIFDDETPNPIAANSTFVPAPSDPRDPLQLNWLLAAQMTADFTPSDELIAGLIVRLNALDRREPATAAAMRRIMMNWQSAAVNRLLLDELKNGKATVDSVVRLLSQRRELRERQPADIYDARGTKNPLALGVTACLLEDPGEYQALLTGGDLEARTAMLGCARLIRAGLPLAPIAENLRSPDKLLARAAELYLESEDSAEARRIVLAHRPNEAKILGARHSFIPENGHTESLYLKQLFASVSENFSVYYAPVSPLLTIERKLQKEVKENSELLGVYAYDGSFIRVYRDRAVFSWEENDARYRERTLTRAEFDYFKNHLVANRVDELRPFVSLCDRCEAKELLMLGRAGGRRVFLSADERPPFFAGLDRIFEEMRKPPARLHYWLEKEVPGLEILFADDHLAARAVWKTGADAVRLLIEDARRRDQIDKELDRMDIAEEANDDLDYEQKVEMSSVRRARRQFEHLSWHELRGDRLAGPTGAPPGFTFPPANDNFPVGFDDEQWKARGANVELRADDNALYKISGGKLILLREGIYIKPLVTPDGRWALVTKLVETATGVSLMLFRVDLQTNREYKIEIGRFRAVQALVFVPSLNKMLVGGSSTFEISRDDWESEEVQSLRGFTFFLVDPATGAARKVTNASVAPLVQQTYRPLQPTGRPDEFWAALPDRKKTVVGTFNQKTLAFTPLAQFPRIAFDSMAMWADAAANKIYVTYHGQLIRLPLGGEKP